jgi:tungstate transport system substrate-binding protein
MFSGLMLFQKLEWNDFFYKCSRKFGLWRFKMKKFLMCLLLVSLIVMGTGIAHAQDKVITMSTTTSTEASGLLDYLLPEFHKDTGITVRVMSKGTGAALRDGMDGNADVVFVHDVAREEQFVQEGFGTKRYYVMYNDFIIVGPDSDPAGIKEASDAVSAMKLIAEAKKPFVSRGDDSGTHAREKQLWEATGLALTDARSPVDAAGWYFSIGQGMGPALLMAEEMQGYVLSDRGTYLQYKYGRQEAYDLGIAYEGGDMLQNPYGVIPVNPEKYPHVKYDLAKTFAEWLVSDRGQEVIGSYQLHGQPLFFPDAK